MNPKNQMNSKESRENVVDAILDILCDREILGRDDTAELKREFEEDESVYLEDYLIDEGIVAKEDLLDTLQAYYGVQAVDVMGEMFDHKLLVKFPKEVLLSNCCLPYYQDGLILFVITNDPRNEELDAVLGEYASYDFEYFVGIPRHIDMMIKDFYAEELYTEEDDYSQNLDRARIDREVVITVDEIKEDAKQKFERQEEKKKK